MLSSRSTLLASIRFTPPGSASSWTQSRSVGEMSLQSLRSKRHGRQRGQPRESVRKRFSASRSVCVPDRDATGAVSRRLSRRAAAVPCPSAQRSITQHRRCMYSFCRRLPPCPAGTQCQCGSAVNVAASSHEWHAMLNEEMSAVVQCDIKQNESECPARCREAISFFKCPTCKPPRDANRKRKGPGPAAVMQRKTKEMQNQTLAKKTDND